MDGKEPRDGNPKRRSAFVGATTAFGVVDGFAGAAVVVSSKLDLNAEKSTTPVDSRKYF
jgi:hypothetical protein